MKTYRAAAGPFSERPFFKPEEIEEICREALRAVDLYPEQPGPVRIERFIEKRFGVRPEYNELPQGLLGYTEFGASGVQRIVISRALDGEGTTAAERRINTTLAHEAGHGLMHAHLFVLGHDTKLLFGNGVDPAGSKILCRGDAISGNRGFLRRGYDGRWWEFQANRAIGALLLPKDLLPPCLENLFVPKGSFGRLALDATQREEAIRRLAETFNVNPVVARIRLEDAYLGGGDLQLTL